MKLMNLSNLISSSHIFHLVLPEKIP